MSLGAHLVHVGRQPIFDAGDSVVAYELLGTPSATLAGHYLEAIRWSARATALAG